MAAQVALRRQQAQEELQVIYPAAGVSEGGLSVSRAPLSSAFDAFGPDTFRDGRSWFTKVCCICSNVNRISPFNIS